MLRLHIQTILRAVFVVFLSLMYFQHIREKVSRVVSNNENVRERKKVAARADRVVFIVLVAAWITFVVPALLDFPRIVDERYEVVTGIVTGEDIKNPEKQKIRDIAVQDHYTGREVCVHVVEEAVPRYSVIEVKYLPHTNNGKVLFIKQNAVEGELVVSSLVKKHRVFMDLVMLAVAGVGIFELWILIRVKSTEHDQTLHSRI